MTKKGESGKLFTEPKQSTGLRIVKHLELDYKEKAKQLSKLSVKQVFLEKEIEELQELIHSLKAKTK